MTLDDQLRRTMAMVTDRVREEAERQMTALTAQFEESLAAARAAAAAQASSQTRTAADKEMTSRLSAAAAVAAAHEKDSVAAAVAAVEARLVAAREEARAEGRELGMAEGRELGKIEGHREGFEEGRQEGTVEGRIVGREEGREEGHLEGRRAGQQMGLREGKRLGNEEGRREAAESRTAELAANERLLQSMRDIDSARSLTEALDALAISAGREAARVAVLLVRGGELRGWRFIGFGDPLDAHHDFDIPSGEAGAIAEAARTGTVASADTTPPRPAPAFANLPPGRELLAVPVQMSGQVIAVLYADQGADRTSGNRSWPSTLEVLARHAARCLESITALRVAQLLTKRPDTGAKHALVLRPQRTLSDGDGSLQKFGAKIGGLMLEGSNLSREKAER